MFVSRWYASRLYAGSPGRAGWAGGMTDSRTKQDMQGRQGRQSSQRHARQARQGRAAGVGTGWVVAREVGQSPRQQSDSAATAPRQRCERTATAFYCHDSDCCPNQSVSNVGVVSTPRQQFVGVTLYVSESVCFRDRRATAPRQRRDSSLLVLNVFSQICLCVNSARDSLATVAVANSSLESCSRVISGSNVYAQ